MKIKHIFIVFAIACFFLTGCNSKPTENPGQNEPLEEFSEVIEDTEPDIDPKLYETLNAYEEYVDSYCEFMKAYMQADVETQLKFADKYVKFNQKIMDAQSMLSEALNDPDTLTKNEYNYIVEVQTRVAAKLLAAASDGLNTNQEASDGKQESN
jgi:hypothetical protein